MMKAAVLKTYGYPLVIEDIPIPAIQPWEVLVKVHACGICHSDIHLTKEEFATIRPACPLILGHEGAGVVEQIGAYVTNVKPGDRVGISIGSKLCFECEHCLAGYELLCPTSERCGATRDGSFAEYVAIDGKACVPLPDNLDFAAAAPFMCAGLTTYKGIKESGAKAGNWLAILGVGGLGHMGVQFGVAMGMKVVAIDIKDESLELAHRLGANMIINAAKEGAVAKVQNEIKVSRTSFVKHRQLKLRG